MLTWIYYIFHCIIFFKKPHKHTYGKYQLACIRHCDYDIPKTYYAAIVLNRVCACGHVDELKFNTSDYDHPDDAELMEETKHKLEIAKQFMLDNNPEEPHVCTGNWFLKTEEMFEAPTHYGHIVAHEHMVRRITLGRICPECQRLSTVMYCTSHHAKSDDTRALDAEYQVLRTEVLVHHGILTREEP